MTYSIAIMSLLGISFLIYCVLWVRITWVVVAKVLTVTFYVTLPWYPYDTSMFGFCCGLGKRPI